MKKLLTIIAAFVITASATVFANNETSAPAIVKSSFETKFGKTANVKWEKVLDVYVATFTNNSDDYKVYFSDEGEFLASSRYIPRSGLPETISSVVKKRFPGSCVTQVLEFASTTNGTSYYLVIANYKADLVVLATIDGKVSVIKKAKK